MTQISDLRSRILSASDNGLEVFKRFCPEVEKVVNTNKKFRLRPEERTPSAQLYPPKDERGWYVIDYGLDGKPMHAVDFYMWINGYGQDKFMLAVRELAEMFGVQEELNSKTNKPRIEQREALPEESGKQPDIKLYDSFIGIDLSSIYSPMVKAEHLEVYDWYNVESITYYKDGKATTVHATDTYPILAEKCYDNDDSQNEVVALKLYQPNCYQKERRFSTIGQMPKNYIFGLRALKKAWHENGEERLPIVLLVSGGSDAVCARAAGYWAVWLNSETRQLTQSELQMLLKYAECVIYIPDNDPTGKRMAICLAIALPNLYTAWLSNKDFGGLHDNRGRPCKDLKDFQRIYPTKKAMDQLVARKRCAQFWYTVKNEKTGQLEYKLTPVMLYYFLWLHGYATLKDDNDPNPVYIHVDGIIVKRITAKNIINFIKEWAESQGLDEALINKILTSKCMPNNTVSHLVERDDLDFNHATANSQRRYYLNRVVDITAEGITSMPYNMVCDGKYVWEDEIIPHNYRQMKPQVSLQKDDDGHYHVAVADDATSNFLRFCQNTSRLNWRKVDEQGRELTQEEKAEEEQCFIAKICNIGYHGHSYKSESAAWATICQDSTLSERDDECAGGSGKSLYIRYIASTLNHFELDGKTLEKKGNPQFMFDGVTDATRLIIVDECSKKFDFNQFYGQITGNLRVEKKSKNTFVIPYKQSPKWIFGTNYTMQNHDPSTERRFWPQLFSDYYHEKTKENGYLETRKVSDDFGQRLLSESYSETDWQSDLSFMQDCLQVYLQLPESDRKQIPSMKHIERREQQAAIGKEFRQWADDYFASENGHLDCPIKADDIVSAFNQETRYNWSPKKVATHLKDYCAFAEHIHCLNPASVTGKDKDGERWIKREDGKQPTYYYIQSVEEYIKAGQQPDKPQEEELPF